MRRGAVLFDLDGTLIDSGPHILASFRYATQKVLRRTIPDEELLAGVGGHGLDAQMRVFSEDHVDELIHVYRAHNLQEYEKVQMFPCMRDVVEELRDDGRPLGIVTVKGRATVELTLSLLKLGMLFDVVVTGDDTPRQKPAPDPILLALEQLDEVPEGASYIGDSPFDIQAAKAANVKAVAVTWGGIHASELLICEQPDAVIDSPLEVLHVV